MSHEPTKKMIETPHIKVLDHCRKCPHILLAASQEPDKVDWGTLRNACRCCKTGNAGIYKADAIYDLYELESALKKEIEAIKESVADIKTKQRPLNVGKKPKIYKTHGKRIMELYEQGEGYASIARLLGLNWKTVKAVIEKLSAENDEAQKAFSNLKDDK